MKADTIAGIATALSESGIGIIRISGKDAIKIADRIFLSKRKDFSLEKAKTHTIHYGYIIDNKDIIDNKNIIDEVLVSVMLAPNSYTAEDVAEINCHGGILVLQKIMELVIQNGARVAEPGEFTKRAFLNGRMDLSEAEAVMDVIESKNDFALQASVKQLRGQVSDVIKELRKKIIYEIAFIESALDDPENYDTEGYPEKLYGISEEILKKINYLTEHADSGKMLKEGIHTVIVGKPNAGKSSFLNQLLGEEKAIVTDIAGTTRDVLEETIRLGGISFQMMDTAGIRNTEDKIEKIGVEKARKYAADADLILYVLDSSVPLDESDEEILELLENKNFIILLNKSDLETVVTEEKIREKLFNRFSEKNYKIIKISALNKAGLEEFEEAVKEMFFQGNISFNDEVMITSMRHKEALLEAEKSICQVRNSINAGMTEDFFSVDLMNAYAALGRIIGEEVDEDLINEIFEKFCTGK